MKAASALDLLVVASWYPAVDDPTAGRFVADQAEALFDTGRVRPVVASFEPATLTGGPAVRRRQLAALEAHAREAVLRHPAPIAAKGWGSERPLPLARLPIAVGGLGRGEPDRPSERRAGILRVFAERLAVDGRAPVLVHAHTCFPDGAAAAEVTRPAGWPLVITEHASFVARLLGDEDTAARYRSAAAQAARFICVSRMLAAEIVAVIPELEPKVVVVPNPVAVRDFPLGDSGERRPDELLFVGYRKPTKGIDHLLETFALVRAQRPQAVLRLIGSSPTDEIEDGWRRRSRELGIADAVSLEPAAGRAAVAQAMRRAALFVHPSPRETFGVVAVEALCSGLPVVATASGGLDEILGDDPRALGGLVPSGDPDALAAAVVDALDRRASFDPQALRASVEQRFGAPVVAQRLLALYDEILGKAASARSSSASVPGPISGGPRPWSMPLGASSGGHGAPATPIQRAASSAGPDGPGRILVIGLDNGRAAKAVGALPEELRSTVILVTGRSVEAQPVDGVLRVARVRGPVVSSRPGRPGPLGRIERLLRDPVGVIRRRMEGGGAVESGLVEPRKVVRALVRELQGKGLVADPAAPAPVDLVCLDGVDHLAAQPLLADPGLRLAPGGVRWLADRWWSRAG